MHGTTTSSDEKNPELDERFPGAGDEVNDAARGLQHEEGKPEMSEDTERPAAAAAIDFEFVLDFCFENFQVSVHAAGGHASEFAIDQSQIGKNRQAREREATCRLA